MSHMRSLMTVPIILINYLFWIITCQRSTQIYQIKCTRIITVFAGKKMVSEIGHGTCLRYSSYKLFFDVQRSHTKREQGSQCKRGRKFQKTNYRMLHKNGRRFCRNIAQNNCTRTKYIGIACKKHYCVTCFFVSHTSMFNCSLFFKFLVFFSCLKQIRYINLKIKVYFKFHSYF